MAWGLEARVPFLDKKFLDVAMNVDPKEKMFNKGAAQQVDEDGSPKMEKVRLTLRNLTLVFIHHSATQYILRKAFDCSPDGKVCIDREEARFTADPAISLICPSQSSGDRRSNSPTVWDIRGSMGEPTHIHTGGPRTAH